MDRPSEEEVRAWAEAHAQGRLVSFAQTVTVCLNTPELMAEYRRLTGSTLGVRPSPLDAMIDKAAGHDPDASQWEPFFRFVLDVVWMPTARRVFAREHGR